MLEPDNISAFSSPVGRKNGEEALQKESSHPFIPCVLVSSTYRPSCFLTWIFHKTGLSGNITSVKISEIMYVLSDVLQAFTEC